MKLKYILFIQVLLIIYCGKSEAQVSFNKRGPGSVANTPQAGNFSNSASLDNVDYSSGTLKISIPLYEIKLKDINVPISINYNGLGIKVGQRPSSVGMGWELNAGGKITTIVNGFPDNQSLKGIAANSSNPMATLAMGATLQVGNTNSADQNFVSKAIDSQIDGAWDVYSYSLPAKGGKYMSFTNGTFLTFPFDGLMRLTSEGDLATGDGLKYSFNTGNQRHIQKRSFYDKDNFSYTDAWTNDMQDVYDKDLIKITSAKHNESVTFNYEYTNQVGLPYPTTVNTVAVPVVRDIQKNTIPYGPVPQFHIKEPSITQTQITTVQATRIQYINFPGGQVVFSYLPDQNGEDVLGTISVRQLKEGVYTTLKSLTFAYVGAPAHYLSSIVESDANGFSVNSWSFTYNDFIPVSTPAPENSFTESCAQDRWGFYNGKTDNKTLIESPDSMLCLATKDHYPIFNLANDNVSSFCIPATSREAVILFHPDPPGRISYANRGCYPSMMKKGMLTSITTPTGDVVRYEYEPHEFMITKATGGHLIPELQYGGGLRIKTITHQGTDGRTLLKKIYKYGMGDSFSSSYVECGFGKVNFPATVLSSNVSYQLQGSGVETNVQDLVLLSHSATDMTYSNGSYAAYGSTTEYIVKDTSAIDKTPNIIKTTYIFKSPDIDGVHFNSLSKEAMPIPTSYPNPGVKNDDLEAKPAVVTKFIAHKSTVDGSINYDKAEETTTAYRIYQAPEPAQKALTNSYLGGIQKIKHEYYNANAMFQYCTYIVDDDGTWHLAGCQAAPDAPVDVFFFSEIERETAYSYYDGKYNGAVTPTYKFSDVFLPDNVIHDVYGSTAQLMQSSTTNYNYSITSLLPSYIYTQDNTGRSFLVKQIKYPLDYSTVTTGGIPAMINNYIFSEPVEQFSTIENTVGGFGPVYLTNGALNTFITDANSFVHNSTAYQLNTQGIPLLIDNYNGITDTRYEPVQQAESFDATGNTVQSTVPGGAKMITLWGYNNLYPVASVVNAVFKDVAYSGFEDVEAGNWVYNAVNRVLTVTPVGKVAYNLSGGGITKDLLTSSTHYILGYWLKSDAAITVTGGTVGPAIAKRSYTGWTYYEREVTGTTSLSITGTGYIDELRLHPFDAAMNTYTYDILIGMTSSTDAKGQTIYYEYDASQRLSQIKDQDGNIVKKIIYNYYNQ